MKILILGAKGTLGCALVSVFETEHEVIAWDKEDLDLLQLNNEKNKIIEISPDIIINTSAINAVDDIETDDRMYEVAKELNGFVPGKLANIAKELGIFFVHYSSDYIFDGQSGTSYTEDDIPNPLSKYGETKFLGECEVKKHGDKYYIIRLSRLFGNAGKSIASKRSFVDTMIYLATEAKKESLDIVSDQISAPTYVLDLAKYTKQLIEEDYPTGVYHAANSGECSWYDWAGEVFNISDIDITISPVSYINFPRPAKVPLYSVLKNTKGPKMRDWKEALKEYLDENY
jgi:dTDP-4-dehydrorhamnose reductase